MCVLNRGDVFGRARSLRCYHIWVRYAAGGGSIAATYIYPLSAPVSRRKVDEISGEELVLDE